MEITSKNVKRALSFVSWKNHGLDGKKNLTTVDLGVSCEAAAAGLAAAFAFAEF